MQGGSVLQRKREQETNGGSCMQDTLLTLLPQFLCDALYFAPDPQQVAAP